MDTSRQSIRRSVRAMQVVFTVGVFGLTACGSTPFAEVAATQPDQPSAATATDEASPDTTPSSPSAPSAPSASWAHWELERELDEAFSDWFESSTAPGAALAVQLSDGSMVEFVGGVANIESGEPITPDSVFRIASISKSMTATVVVDLAEDGLIDLDAPVDDYLGRGWVGAQPYASEITVRQLLNHTSGLPEYLFTPAFGAEAQGRYGAAWTPEEILEFIGRQGASAEPGSRYAYNTGGFIAAGRIIEEVTGQSTSMVMQDRLFAPAGASSIGLPPDHPLSPEHVSGYVDGALAQMMIASDPSNDEGVRLANGTPVVDVLAADQAGLRSSGWTGGGIEATVASTAAVWHAMFDGTVLGADAVAEVASRTDGANYGLGVMLNRADGSNVYTHSGLTAGFRSEAGFVESADASFAMSANTTASGNRIDALEAQVIDILAKSA